MRSQKDYERIKLQNDLFSAVMQVTLGDRQEQQDCIGMQVDESCGLFVICDGMGGCVKGKEASSIAMDTILSAYSQYEGESIGPDELQNMMRQAHNAVLDKAKNAGTTCVLVHVRDRKMMWCSVGDSRAYILRGKQFLQLTQDHNYKTVLDARLENGEISKEEYERELEKGEYLINYIGMPEMNLMDFNQEPLKLQKDDSIVLMSDGLYKYASNQEIFQILNEYKESDAVLDALERKLEVNKSEKELIRDNTSIGIIKIN